MLIDRNTVSDLELINNAILSKSKQSLFGLLNHTHTPMGNRLLRGNLLAPLTEIEVIERRLEAVQELIELEDSFFNLRKALKLLVLPWFQRRFARVKRSMTSRLKPVLFE